MPENTAGTVWDILEHQFATQRTLDWNPGRPVALAVYSEKGGVGKTSLTAGLIAVMSAHGRKVLAVDLDPRATLTNELGVDDPELGVNDLLYEDENADPDDLPALHGLAADALTPASEVWPGVQVIAATRALGNREADNTTPDLEHRLRISLAGVTDQFDMVIMDLPPRPGGKLVTAGLLAATDVLYTSYLTQDGKDGVEQAMTTMRHISRRAPQPIRQVGIVRAYIEMRRTNIAVEFDRQFREQFGDMLLNAAIPKRVIREEARTARVPITIAADKRDAQELISGYIATLNAIGRP